MIDGGKDLVDFVVVGRLRRRVAIPSVCGTGIGLGHGFFFAGTCALLTGIQLEKFLDSYEEGRTEVLLVHRTSTIFARSLCIRDTLFPSCLRIRRYHNFDNFLYLITCLEPV